MGNNVQKEKFGSIYSGNKIRPGYYVSKNKVMYGGNQIILLQEETNFKKLKFGYAKTNIRVFFKGIPIHGADPVSFDTLTRTSAKSKVPNLKLNSVLGIDYQLNKKRIYQFGSLIHVE